MGSNDRSMGRFRKSKRVWHPRTRTEGEKREQFLESEEKVIWRGPGDRRCGLQERNFVVRESGEEMSWYFSFPSSVSP